MCIFGDWPIFIGNWIVIIVVSLAIRIIPRTQLNHSPLSAMGIPYCACVCVCDKSECLSSKVETHGFIKPKTKNLKKIDENVLYRRKCRLIILYWSTAGAYTTYSYVMLSAIYLKCINVKHPMFRHRDKDLRLKKKIKK